jgi:hypothetical protein
MSGFFARQERLLREAHPDQWAEYMERLLPRVELVSADPVPRPLAPGEVEE